MKSTIKVLIFVLGIILMSCSQQTPKNPSEATEVKAEQTDTLRRYIDSESSLCFVGEMYDRYRTDTFDVLSDLAHRIIQNKHSTSKLVIDSFEIRDSLKKFTFVFKNKNEVVEAEVQNFFNPTLSDVIELRITKEKEPTTRIQTNLLGDLLYAADKDFLVGRNMQGEYRATRNENKLSEDDFVSDRFFGKEISEGIAQRFRDTAKKYFNFLQNELVAK